VAKRKPQRALILWGFLVRYGEPLRLGCCYLFIPVQPFAYVVANYTCYNRDKKSENKICHVAFTSFLLAENQKKGQEDTAMIEEAQPQAEGTKLQAEASQDGSFLAEADAGTDQAVIDSWDGGEEAGMENPGEAVLTSGLTVSDYIAGVQLNREQIRARNKETLNSIINSTFL
jgi:hypothetical protein